MEWRIEYFTDKVGAEPVRDFINAQSLDAQVGIFHVIGLLETEALNLGYPYVFKMGKTNIRELRIRHSSDIYRIFFFAFTGRKFVLLHGFLKKTKKTPKRELETAIRRLNDYIQR